MVKMILFLSVFFIKYSLAHVNHAPLDKRHDDTAERFIERNLLTNGQFDLAKIDHFITRLENEYEALKSDLYETAIIQNIEINLESLEEARDNALRELNFEKNNLLYAFKKFLQPLMYEIRDLVVQGESRHIIDGKLDKFIELYHVYFIPEKPRYIFQKDIPPKVILSHLRGYHFKKDDLKKVEANNLVAGRWTHEINHCLGNAISSNTILTEENLRELRNCNFDLSLLEPVDNPFIKDLSPEEKEKRKTDFLHLFPAGDEEFFFEFIIYSGAGSPKFVGSFFKDINGERKKVTFKVKIGPEVHNDPAGSMIGKLLGLSQDHSLAYPKMRFYFKEGETIESFTTKWRRMYRNGTRDISQYVVAQSSPEEARQWVEIQDISIEVRDPNIRGLTPFEPWAWDLPNRREHRGILLWYAFIAARDLKTGNQKVKLIESENGYNLEYSTQDIGKSFGDQLDIRHPIQSIFGGGNNGVNYYRPSFMSWNDEHVHLYWHDLGVNRIKFGTTTYDDLRWMARKIAKLTYEDFKYSFTIAGYPAPLVELLLVKVGHRRDEIIQGFDLEDEFSSWNMPELATFSIPPYIKNGKVVVDGIDGHTEFMATSQQADTSRNIVNAALNNLPLEKVMAGIKVSLGTGLNLSNEQAVIELKDKPLGKLFKFEAIGGNIKFQLRRNIALNTTPFPRGEGEMGRWLVKDTLVVGFNIKADTDNFFERSLPVGIKTNITIYERAYEHIQPVSNWKTALTAPFKLFFHIANSLENTAENLDMGDVFKIQDRVGFDISAHAGINLTQSPFLRFDAAAGIGWSYSRPLYIHRDHVGDVYIFRESRKSFMGALGIYFLGVDLPILEDLPLLGISYTFTSLKNHSEMFKFTKIKQDTGHYSKELQRREIASFFDGGNPILYLKNKVLDIQAQGSIQKLKLDFLLLFHGSKSHNFFKIKTVNEGKERNFYRYHVYSQYFVGDQEIATYAFKNPWIFTRSLTQWSISIELEEKNMETATAFMEFQDFRMSMNRNGLLSFISRVDEQFTPNPDVSIYRTDHLPPNWEVSRYLKVLSHMRIQVGIGKFITSLNSQTYQDIKQRITRRSQELGIRMPRTFLWLIKRGIGQIQRYRNNPAKQIKSMARILQYINKQKYGVRLLSEMVGMENIFVYGEIMGIYHGYSAQQEHEGVVSRKYAAKSWGDLTGIPPLRKYLSTHIVSPIYVYLLNDDISEEIFGKLPSTIGPPHT